MADIASEFQTDVKPHSERDGIRVNYPVGEFSALAHSPTQSFTLSVGSGTSIPGQAISGLGAKLDEAALARTCVHHRVLKR